MIGSRSCSICPPGKLSSHPMNTIAWYILMLFLMSGCASSFTSFTDKETKNHIVRMNGNRLAGGITSLELNAQQFSKNNQISYSLFIVYAGPLFLNIGPGKSLTLIIDGQRNEIAGSGSEKHRNIVSLGLVEEIAYYHDLEPSLIKRLAYAKEVEVEVQGSTKTLKRYFKKKNFSKFKEFCNLYMDKTAVHP